MSTQSQPSASAFIRTPRHGLPISRKASTRAFSVALAVLLMAAGCGGGGGSSSDSAGRQAGNPPTLSLSASPNSVNAGGASTLRWESTGADSCTASGAWSGDRPRSGSERVANIRTTSRFSLSCSGPGGSTLREVTVNVGGSGLAVSLSVSEPVVLVGDQVEVSWSAPAGASCEAAGDWSGRQATSGTYTTGALARNATFRLTCSAGGRTGVAMVSVTVTDKEIRWRAPTENVDGTELVDLESFNVYWGNGSRTYTSSVTLPASALSWEADLPAGRYYFAVTATNSRGEESDYSNEITKLIPY